MVFNLNIIPLILTVANKWFSLKFFLYYLKFFLTFSFLLLFNYFFLRVFQSFNCFFLHFCSIKIKAIMDPFLFSMNHSLLKVLPFFLLFFSIILHQSIFLIITIFLSIFIKFILQVVIILAFILLFI